MLKLGCVTFGHLLWIVMHSDLSCGRSDHQIATSRRLDITLIRTEKDAFIAATIALVYLAM